MEDNTSMAENLSGAETTPTTAPVVGDQTVEDSLLAGFSDEGSVDGRTSDESDSKGGLDGDVKQPNSEDLNKDGSGRPDRRSRSSERIQQVLAEKRELTQRIKELEMKELERAKPNLKLDEDGNVSIEDMAKHQESLIQYELRKREAATLSKIRDVQREAALETAISDLQVSASQLIKENSFLDEKSPDYSPEASQAIFKSVLERVQQLQAAGVDDYVAMKDHALEELSRQVNLVKIAEKRAQTTGVRNYQQMQDGAALTSSNGGRPSGSNDTFLTEFLSD